MTKEERKPHKYKLTFGGRKKGAIGISGVCTVVVEAFHPDDAWLKAYDTHEHIYPLSIQQLPDRTGSTA